MLLDQVRVLLGRRLKDLLDSIQGKAAPTGTMPGRQDENAPPNFSTTPAFQWDVEVTIHIYIYIYSKEKDYAVLTCLARLLWTFPFEPSLIECAFWVMFEGDMCSEGFWVGSLPFHWGDKEVP